MTVVVLFGHEMNLRNNEKSVKKKRAYTKAPVPVPVVVEDLVAEERRETVGKMYLKRHRLSDIAKALNISVMTVREDLEVIRKEWIGRASAEMIQLRAEEFAKIDATEAAAWASFERSLRDYTETSATKVGPGGQPVTRAVTYKRDGDPRWLAIVAKCIDQRTRLMNLNLQPDDPAAAAIGSQVVVVLPENFRARPKQIKGVVNEAHVE